VYLVRVPYPNEVAYRAFKIDYIKK
jgi:hypothetical protein